MKYGLDVYAPVGPGGHYLEEVGLFGGQRVFDANPKVEAALAERGRLWHRESFQHSYPHCWRCHNPVIFLATAQWFITDGSDQPRPATDKTLREMSLDAVKQVAWLPTWGEERIHNMLANRPTGASRVSGRGACRSRRSSCSKCGHVMLTRPLIDRAAADVRGAQRGRLVRTADRGVPAGRLRLFVVRRHAVRARDEHPRRVVRLGREPRGRAGAAAGAAGGRRMSIWKAAISIAAGSTARCWSAWARARARRTAGSSRTASSSPRTAARCRSRSATRSSRRRSSSSTAPTSCGCGARWSTTGKKLRLGKEILARVVEAYRKLRNTLRYLLQNLGDFNPATDRGRRWTSCRKSIATSWRATPRSRGRCCASYDAFDYTPIVQAVTQFAIVDLSAFYLDVSKDRLYTFGVDVRSAALGADRDVSSWSTAWSACSRRF